MVEIVDSGDHLLKMAIKELAMAEKFVDALQKLSNEITNTSLDLSAKDKYDHYDAREIFEILASELIDDFQFDPDAINPESALSTIKLVTNTYRNAVLNTLLGIHARFNTINSFKEEIGPDRDHNKDQILELSELMDKGYEIILTKGSMGRHIVEEFMTDFIIRTNEYWSPLFTKREHQLLARKLLKGEIGPEELKSEFLNMNPPEIDIDDFNERYPF